MQPRKFRILSAITAGSLALAVAAITASAGTSQPATHAALAAQNESFPPVNLDACPTLHTGYPTGGCVAQLQTDLNTILGLNLSVDGTFGPVHSQTYNAVIAFQQKYHLSQDGKVGPDTKNALERALSGDSVPTPTVPPATTSAPSAPASGAPVTSPAPSANAGSPTGELTALYVHFLDRQPDGVSWNNYMNSGLGINSDCRSGMLRATYDIATSAEAINRWQTPQNLAGAIYAGMLDRVPDPAGLQHYTSLIQGEGMGAAVMDVMASQEYKNRMNVFCAGHSTTNATVLNPSDSSGIAHGLTDVAKTTAEACGVSELTGRMFKLWGVPSPAIAIDAAAKLALKYAGTSKACSATYTLLSAAYFGQQMAEAGDNVYWMTQQWDTHTHVLVWTRTTTHVIVRVGMNPGDGVHFYETEFTS